MRRGLVCAAIAALLVIPAAAAKKQRPHALAADTFSLVGTPAFGATVQLAGTGENWAAISCSQLNYSVGGWYWNYDPGYDPGVTPEQDTTIAFGGNFVLSSDIWDPSLPAACRALRWTEAPYTELESFEFTVPAAG